MHTHKMILWAWLIKGILGEVGVVVKVGFKWSRPKIGSQDLVVGVFYGSMGVTTPGLKKHGCIIRSKGWS